MSFLLNGDCFGRNWLDHVTKRHLGFWHGAIFAPLAQILAPDSCSDSGHHLCFCNPPFSKTSNSARTQNPALASDSTTTSLTSGYYSNSDTFRSACIVLIRFWLSDWRLSDSFCTLI